MEPGLPLDGQVGGLRALFSQSSPCGRLPSWPFCSSPIERKAGSREGIGFSAGESQIH